MQVATLDGPSALRRADLPDPRPHPRTVAVQVHSVGCNFADILICQGKYQKRPGPPFAPGAEVAGTVCAVGEGVRGLREGDRVLALLDWGGYASHVVVPAERVLPLPDDVPFDEATALGVVYQTSWFALKHRAPLRPGETLLVHAAAGGVGLAAVQIGAAMDARVLGTAGSEEKRRLVREHGAAEALDYRDPGWIDQVREWTGGRGVDVVFDPVGGDAFDGSTRCIAWEGRIHVIGFASGTIPTMRLNRLLLKNISVVGLHWGPYLEHDPALVRRAAEDLFAMYARGEVRPVVSQVRPLEQAAAALEELGARRTVGKIVLRA
ncbi:MAG: NADPH:quinone oxidoreductase family protein [Myxococcota bacterium]